MLRNAISPDATGQRIVRSTEPTAQDAWYRDWGNIALCGLAIYVATYLLWITFEWGSHQTFTMVREMAYPPIMLLGVILAWRVSRVSTIPERTRQAWTVIGSAFFIWFAADAIWAYYHVTGTTVPALSLFDPAYLISSLVLALGVLLFPAAALRGRDRTRFWIDTGIIVAGLSALTAYVIIGPGYLEATSNTLGAIILLAYPLSHMLVIIVVFSIIVRRPDAGSLGVLMLLGAGLVLYAATDFWWTFLEVRGMYVHDAVSYGSWMVAQALLVAGPQRHYDVINRNLPTSAPGPIVHRAREIVPFMAGAIGMLIVGFVALPGMLDRFGVAVFFLTVLVTLIVVRQVVTIRENGALRLHRAIRENEERFKALVEHSSDMMTVLDRDWQLTFQSPSSREVIGRDPDDFVGTSILNWVHEDDRERVRQSLEVVMAGDSTRETFSWRMPALEEGVTHLESIVSNELENPAVGGLVLNTRDVTDRKQLEERLTYQAFHDPLTDLPNRTKFFQHLEMALDLVESGPGVALLFVDIDNFKQINDTLGHDAGDELLRQTTGRLKQVLRHSDILSRLAGDEFTILLRNVPDIAQARMVAERVLESLREPIEVRGTSVRISSSVGVGYAASPYVNSDRLLHQADLAMYAAKRRGPGGYAVFAPWMEDLSYDPDLSAKASGS